MYSEWVEAKRAKIRAAKARAKEEALQHTRPVDDSDPHAHENFAREHYCCSHRSATHVCPVCGLFLRRALFHTRARDDGPGWPARFQRAWGAIAATLGDAADDVLAPPCDDATIDAVNANLKGHYELPPDFVACMKVHNGFRRDAVRQVYLLPLTRKTKVYFPSPFGASARYTIVGTRLLQNLLQLGLLPRSVAMDAMATGCDLKANVSKRDTRFQQRGRDGWGRQCRGPFLLLSARTDGGEVSRHLRRTRHLLLDLARGGEVWRYTCSHEKMGRKLDGKGSPTRGKTQESGVDNRLETLDKIADDFITFFEAQGLACQRTKALLENPPHLTTMRQMMRVARKTADVAARAAARRKREKDARAAKIAARAKREKELAERWFCEICEYPNHSKARQCAMCETARDLMAC